MLRIYPVDILESSCDCIVCVELVIYIVSMTKKQRLVETYAKKTTWCESNLVQYVEFGLIDADEENFF